MSYADAGATRPGEQPWTQQPAGFRRFERTVWIGRGDRCWETSGALLMRWGVKTRSGFTVAPTVATERVQVQESYWLLARLGLLTIREPVRVVAVVDEPDRRGFAYGTLAGHPVCGEEAFIVHRTCDHDVWLTLRSLTRPSRGAWGLAFPGLLVAQRWYRARYLRALRGDD